MRVRDFMACPGELEAKYPYLKDFHLCRELAVLSTALPYSVPAPLADDLLNGYFDALVTDAPGAGAVAGLQSRAGDDFRFLYAGPPGSWTPVHHDVLYSASWSVNVTGWKVWVLVEPGTARASLYQGGSPQGDLVTDSLFTPAEAAIVEEVAAAVGGDAWVGGRVASCGSTQPLSAALEAPGARALCAQGPGDVIFVPGGWRAWRRGARAVLAPALTRPLPPRSPALQTTRCGTWGPAAHSPRPSTTTGCPRPAWQAHGRFSPRSSPPCAARSVTSSRVGGVGALEAAAARWPASSGSGSARSSCGRTLR